MGCCSGAGDGSTGDPREPLDPAVHGEASDGRQSVAAPDLKSLNAELDRLLTEEAAAEAKRDGKCFAPSCNAAQSPTQRTQQMPSGSSELRELNAELDRLVAEDAEAGAPQSNGPATAGEQPRRETLKSLHAELGRLRAEEAAAEATRQQGRRHA